MADEDHKNNAGYIELNGRLENLKEVTKRHDEDIRDLSGKELQDIRDIQTQISKINENIRDISEKVVKQSSLVNLIEILNSNIAQLNAKIATIPDIQREVAVMNNKVANASELSNKLDELNREIRRNIDEINREIRKCSDDFDGELKDSIAGLSTKLSAFENKFAVFLSKEYVDIITKLTDMDSERRFIKFILPFGIALLSTIISLLVSVLSAKLKN